MSRSRQATTPVKPSLGARLLQHAMPPLAVTWALGAAIAVLIGDTFTQQAFDRALLDDAYVVSAHVDREGAGLALSLTDEELDAVLFDQSETVYFAVLADDGALIAGQAGLSAAAPPAAGATYAFSTIRLGDRRLRAVVLKQRGGDGFSVVIAQTTLARSQLLQKLLIYSVVPQLLLLALVAWGLRRVIRQDLAPLAALQRTLDQRDAADLTPMPPEVAGEANSREVERVGVAINALLERVSAGVRAQREFAGTVAHELRTPLAGIRALAEYGLAQSDPQKQREQLQAIVDSQARASRLVDQLLALALADEARDSLVREPVALGALARGAVLQRLVVAEQAGVDLGAQGLEQEVTVLAHPALVEGMLVNLIDNALRHGRSAVSTASVVTVALAHDAETAVLSVTDNGPGLGSDEQRSLLQRWAQGSNGERLGEGAGLGLAIVARYAELLGARFELVDAASGPGLCARLVFSRIAG